MTETGPLRHTAMLASAGSGKTFQLGLRYVRLLIMGVSPDRIVALTFSHKASFEMLDRIVHFLCEASESEHAAATLSSHLGCEHPIDCTTFRSRLRGLVDNLHRLRVGTLDSFAIRIVRAFPYELGVSPDFTVGEEAGPAALALRLEVLRDIFHPGRMDSQARADFLEAFKRADMGREHHSLVQRLTSYIEKHHAAFRRVPEGLAWGNPSRIWPKGHWILDTEGTLRDAIQETFSILNDAAFADAGRSIIAAFLTSLLRWRPGVKIDETRYKNLMTFVVEAAQTSSHQGTMTLDRKKYKLTGAVAEAFYTLARCLLRDQMLAQLRQTRSLHSLIERYAHIQSQRARITGCHTFAEIQEMLSPLTPNGIALSSANSSEGRLHIDYRLDGRYDHWLLDEFQDTSDTQWSIFENLIDEVVQDPEGRRSFFLVGDVKQSIYAWRGGNPRLFSQVLARYGAGIQRVPLDCSYRSGPSIIATVNKIFSGPQDDYLHPLAAADWQETWHEHRCAPAKLSLNDYAAALVLPASSEKSDIFHAIVPLLQRICPLERGLTVAVLVRTNEDASTLADILRTGLPEYPVSLEGRSSLDDEPAVQALISWLRWLAHPGDTFAEHHVAMTPLAPLLGSRGDPSSPNAATSPVSRARAILDHLARAEQHGVRSLLLHGIREMEKHATWTTFTLARLQDFLHAAARFDTESPGNPNLDQFIDFAQRWTTKDPAAKGAVRIMNVHQSKGLDFDIVIAPFSGRTIAGKADANTLLVNPPDRVLMKPAGLPEGIFPEVDDMVAEAYRTDSFEAFCIMYVALTRARQGLYMVWQGLEPGKKSAARNDCRLLETRLSTEASSFREDPEIGGAWVYECGDPTWYEARPARPREQTSPVQHSTPPPRKNAHRHVLTRRTPSGSAHARIDAGDALRMRGAGRGLGSIVHGMFALLEWLPDSPLDAIATTFTLAKSNPLTSRAANLFLSACASPAFQQHLSRSGSTPITLWREKSFEVIDGHEWLTGTFDRVELFGPAGNWTAARILDFKTDRVTASEGASILAERYAPQLRLYQRALHHLTHIPEKHIACGILVTNTHEYVAIPL